MDTGIENSALSGPPRAVLPAFVVADGGVIGDRTDRPDCVYEDDDLNLLVSGLSEKACREEIFRQEARGIHAVCSYESDGTWSVWEKSDRVKWERFGFRGEVAKLLSERGLDKKAMRFVNCDRLGCPGVCPEGHKFFKRHGCEIIFCQKCAAEQQRQLFQDYLHVILESIHEHGVPERWVLARINFTLRSDGSEITPERVKKLNRAVRETMQKTVGSRKGFGMLFLDEVGYEKRGHTRRARKAGGLNLHVHGLYFGPHLDWERTRDLWAHETQRRFGEPSLGFWITAIPGFRRNPERAVRHALNHMLKYVSKPPAVSAERLASLIAAFDGARRVHALGLFYGKKSKRDTKGCCLCPKCKAMGIEASVISFEGRLLPNGGCIPRLVPIEKLQRLGYEPLIQAWRSAVMAMGVSREESWGASP